MHETQYEICFQPTTILTSPLKEKWRDSEKLPLQKDVQTKGNRYLEHLLSAILALPLAIMKSVAPLKQIHNFGAAPINIDLHFDETTYSKIV